MVLFDDDADSRSVEGCATDLGDALFDVRTRLEQLDARLDDIRGEYSWSDLVSVCPLCFNRVPVNSDRDVLGYCVECGLELESAFLIDWDDATVVRVVETV